MEEIKRKERELRKEKIKLINKEKLTKELKIYDDFCEKNIEIGDENDYILIKDLREKLHEYLEENNYNKHISGSYIKTYIKITPIKDHIINTYNTIYKQKYINNKIKKCVFKNIKFKNT
jgi:hypothetical protein